MPAAPLTRHGLALDTWPMIDPAGGNSESRFVTADDGVRLHLLRWRSAPSPLSAVVVFLHGIASHAGWFGETATDLSRQGVEVYGPDRRGSGYGLERYRDNPRLDFTRLDGQPGVHFTHARGFVAKTSITDVAALKALLARAAVEM